MAKPKPCLVNILKIWLRRRMSRIFWPIFLSCMYYPLRVYLTRKFRQDNRINSFELVPLIKGERGCCIFDCIILQPPLPPFLRGIHTSHMPCEPHEQNENSYTINLSCLSL